jgi:hypothetical protein
MERDRQGVTAYLTDGDRVRGALELRCIVVDVHDLDLQDMIVDLKSHYTHILTAVQKIITLQCN